MFIDPRLRHDVAWAEAPGGRAVLIGYLDGGGVPTNGFGHTGPDVWLHQLITNDQAVAWLDRDLTLAASYAVHLNEWPALDTDARRNAIIECVFNLGPHNWTNEFPNTRKCLANQDWRNAGLELMDSPKWIRQVGIARVTRLSLLISVGTYLGNISSQSPAFALHPSLSGSTSSVAPSSSPS